MDKDIKITPEQLAKAMDADYQDGGWEEDGRDSHLLRIRKEEIEGARQLMTTATYYGLLTICY